MKETLRDDANTARWL